MVELLLAVVPVDKLVGNLAVVFEFPLARYCPWYLASYFVGFLAAMYRSNYYQQAALHPEKVCHLHFQLAQGYLNYKPLK